jgi:hypothetical protein
MSDDATPPVDPPAAPAPAADPAPAPPADWTAALDDDAKAFATGKGFKSPAEALAALRGYEPPPSPDAYEIPVPDGESADFAKSIAPVLHKAGLSVAQAKTLAAEWNTLQATQRQAAQQAEVAAAQAAAQAAQREAAELKVEWGTDHDANTEHARRAAMRFLPGDSDEAKAAFVAELEKKFGFGATMRMWAAIGRGLGEHQAKGLNSPPGPPRVSPQSFYDKSSMNP